MKTFTAIFFTLILAGLVSAQEKPIMPPAETESLHGQQRWLTNAVTKYGSYRTLNLSVVISSAKFTGCQLDFVQTRKLNAAAQDTMGVTTKTNTLKQNISIDLAQLDTATIDEHVDLTLRQLSIKLRRAENDFRNVDLVVREEAADAIKTTLERIGGECKAGKLTLTR
jgi:hypothetical protein